MLRQLLPLSLIVLATTAYAVDVPPVAPPPDTAAPIEAVVLHPLFDVDFMCSEHFEGQVPYLGDALGSDCTVMGGLEGDGESGYTRPFRTDGKANEDWYGWRTPVLSPLAGTVDRVNINAAVNVPGQLGKPPASFILISAADGTRVMVAHVDDILVEAGDMVQAGQPLGVVGNNGFARAPHIHLGAWRGETPLQVRFDLRAMGALRKKGDAGE